MGGFLPRFVVEAVFLGLLAAAAALAELRPALIVAVMAAGWLIVTGIEWLAWRSEQRAIVPGRRPPRPTSQPAADWDLDDILAPPEEEALDAGEATRVRPPEEN